VKKERKRRVTCYFTDQRHNKRQSMTKKDHEKFSDVKLKDS